MKTKETDAGVLIVKESDTTTRYKITTLPWNYRWGKIYFADKRVVIVSWKAEVTLDIDGRDTTIILTPDSWEYIISSWVPNIFYFSEYTEMIEEFPKWTKTKNFERYRAMKN